MSKLSEYDETHAAVVTSLHYVLEGVQEALFEHVICQEIRKDGADTCAVCDACAAMSALDRAVNLIGAL